MGIEDGWARRGQPLRGEAATDWGARRHARNLSLTELAHATGIPRSVVGLICQGRLVPTDEQTDALERVLPREA